MEPGRLDRSRESVGRAGRAAHLHSRSFLLALSQYSVVLALILAIYLLVAILPTTRFSQSIVVVLQALTFLFALVAARPSRLISRLGLVMALVAMALAIFGTAVLADATAFTAVLGAALLLLALGAVLVHLVTARRASAQLVLGAIDAYLLIGLLFAFVFAALGSREGNLALAAATEATNGDYLVYSYATLTTLGGSNLVAQNNLVSTFAVLEAMIGQIFLVTVIARLVALWASPPSHHSAGAPSG